MTTTKPATPIPGRVRVGPMDYPISVLPQDNLEGFFGRFNVKGGIRISDDCGSYEPVVLLHEIMHAIMYHQSLSDLPHDLEERIVNSVSEGLAALIRDNPQLIEYLSTRLR